jgi:hypothetical protein
MQGAVPVSSDYSQSNLAYLKKTETELQSKTFHRPSATWSQWPTPHLADRPGEEEEEPIPLPSGVLSSLSRANIILDNFNKIQNTQRLFITGHNNSSFSQQTANA